MSKVIKQMEMSSLKTTFKDVRDMVLLSVVGLNSIADNQVRLALRKKGIRLQMVKNSLTRRVFADMGMKIDKGWEGPTTLAWGGSSVAELSKEISPLLKKYEKIIKVKGVVADGQEVSFELALKMPTRAEALGRIITLALSPARRLASQILGPASQVAGQIKSLKDRKEPEAAAPAPAAAEPTPA
jgi:large subunit ribosomal protein L10